MKKKAQKLKLGKRIISELNQSNASQIKGGFAQLEQEVDMWSGGCTDGCGITATHWNCTKTNCTNDCSLSCLTYIHC